MDKRAALERLQDFVKLVFSAGVKDAVAFRQWSKENQAKMAEMFDYEQVEGMPSITTLVSAAFHPTLPLILLNYTQTAHNTLHEFPAGWTMPLRLCRGVVFDANGQLVALPFVKFFNYGDHPETRTLPNEAFEATVKQDGHLGIVFYYSDQFVLTTRGQFTSPTSKLGGAILNRYAKRNDWQQFFPKDITLLVEIIDPETQVYVNYGDRSEFVVIGATNNKTLHDFNYNELTILAGRLHLPITDLWQGNNLADLIGLMADRSVENQEGFVIRFASGLRVKVKFQTYIGKMVAGKLSYAYLMRRYMAGNLERMLLTLPEEIYLFALKMLGQIMQFLSLPGTPKERWRKLYELLPEDQRTPTFKATCREFVKHFTS